MRRQASIQEQITALQEQNESLLKLEKLANQYCKLEFGFSVREIHKMIDDQLRYMQKKSANQH